MIRVLDALVLLWLVTVLTFALIHLAPGDPATLFVAPTATADEVVRQRATFGLDAPLPIQYGRWIGALLRGDLGSSLVTARPVVAIIIDAFPLSLALGGTSLLLSFVVGTLVGGWQARRASAAADTTISIVSTVVYAAPSFWLALALVVLATSGASAVGAPAWLRLPAFGVESPGGMTSGFDRWRDLVRHAVLPLLVLSLPGAAGVARYARQAMRDAARAPHVAAAFARGLSPARVEWRYVLRTSLTSLVVLFGLTLPGVIAGSVFVEQVFAWPGLGRTMMGAIASRDYPVVLGLTVLYATTVIVANVLADLALLWLDPRQRAGDQAVSARA